ncbi:MAG: protein tyrosine phosphatase [Chlamydiales bacterium]|jgi:protein tyrosine phosphatase
MTVLVPISSPLISSEIELKKVISGIPSFISQASTYSGRSFSTHSGNDCVGSSFESAISSSNRIFKDIDPSSKEADHSNSSPPTQAGTPLNITLATPTSNSATKKSSTLFSRQCQTLSPIRENTLSQDLRFFELCLGSLSNNLEELLLSPKKVFDLSKMIALEMEKLKQRSTPDQIPEWSDGRLIAGNCWSPINIHPNHHCLATGYPEDPESFWEEINNSSIGAIFDLTDLKGDLLRKDFSGFYYPQNVNDQECYENITVTCVRKTQLPHFTFSAYKIYDVKKQTDELSYRIHVSDWPEGTTISPEKLDVLVQAMQVMRLLLPDASAPNVSPILVHSMGGVGRTGSLISAEAIHSLVDGLLPKQSIASKITPKVSSLILNGRMQRSRDYVQTSRQEHTLYYYALSKAHSQGERLSEII